MSARAIADALLLATGPAGLVCSGSRSAKPSMSQRRRARAEARLPGRRNPSRSKKSGNATIFRGACARQEIEALEDEAQPFTPNGRQGGLPR